MPQRRVIVRLSRSQVPLGHVRGAYAAAEAGTRPPGRIADRRGQSTREFASTSWLCFTDVVLAYGIASRVSHDAEDFYATAAEAEATLAEILADDRELEGALWVEPLKIDLSPN